MAESQPKVSHKIILALIGIVVLAMGITLYFIPPAVFPDPGMGFQVLRSMQLGSAFNTFAGPDQSDISQNYSEFLTWWTPGQYLVPYAFKLLAGINLGKAIALTVALGSISGLSGFYFFFKKIGFTARIAAISLLFIICQQAFVIPYVYYNGGEILLFAFEGWFLYGCISFKKVSFWMVVFVLLSGWLGFFCKSTFLWIYSAGLLCLLINISGLWEWVKKIIWIGIPAVFSLACIYLFFISKGTSPASAAHGFKLTIETFAFPIASPMLSGFSIDDLLNGIVYHTDKILLNYTWSIILLILLALSSLWLISKVVSYAPNKDYRVFVFIFYTVSVIFFGFAFLRQVNVSYEARHFRIIGLLIVPGVIHIINISKPLYKITMSLLVWFIGFNSFSYLIKGYIINDRMSARGVTGIAQPDIDQVSLNYIMKLDKENKNAVFVFIGDDTGLEIMQNRIISLQPVETDLTFTPADSRFLDHAGPLYIVLPAAYKGPRENMIMNSFPGYKGFEKLQLSKEYVLYSAK